MFENFSTKRSGSISMHYSLLDSRKTKLFRSLGFLSAQTTKCDFTKTICFEMATKSI